MKYVRNGIVKEYRELRNLNRTISLPVDGSLSISIGNETWLLLEETPKPQYDKTTHKVIETNPSGTKQEWKIVPLSANERSKILDENSKLEIDSNWIRYEAARKQAWIDAGMPEYGA